MIDSAPASCIGGRYEVKTEPRQRPENVKEQLVVEHEYKNIRLVSEDVAEIEYQPTACKKKYGLVIVRKNLAVVTIHFELK